MADIDIDYSKYGGRIIPAKEESPIDYSKYGGSVKEYKSPLSEKEQNVEKLKSAMVSSPSGMLGQGMKEIAGGMLNSLYQTGKSLPNIGSPISSLAKNIVSDKDKPDPIFDPYKAMGTEEKPFYTPGGFMQLIGEMVGPIKSMPKAGSLSTGGKELIKKVISSISPQKAAGDLIEHLGQGLPHTQASTQAITNSIRNAHDSHLQQAVAHLEFPLQQAGHEKIYDHIDPLITTQLDKSKSLINKMEDFNIGDLLGKFKAEPTLQNAHDLQSELGNMVGHLKANLNLSSADRLELKNIRKVREELKTHIKDFLKKRDQTSNIPLLNQYTKGSELYEKNVSPYLSSKKLRQIVREGRTSVRNVEDLFKSPYDIVEKISGKDKTGPINKILSDLPDETKDKIMFNIIGGRLNQGDPKKILESLEKAEQKGYSHLFTDKTKQLKKEVESRVNNKGRITSVGKFAGGGSALLTGEEILRHLMSGNKE